MILVDRLCHIPRGGSADSGGTVEGTSQIDTRELSEFRLDAT